MVLRRWGLTPHPANEDPPRGSSTAADVTGFETRHFSSSSLFLLVCLEKVCRADRDQRPVFNFGLVFLVKLSTIIGRGGYFLGTWAWPAVWKQKLTFIHTQYEAAWHNTNLGRVNQTPLLSVTSAKSGKYGQENIAEWERMCSRTEFSLLWETFQAPCRYCKCEIRARHADYHCNHLLAKSGWPFQMFSMK